MEAMPVSTEARLPGECAGDAAGLGGLPRVTFVLGLANLIYFSTSYSNISKSIRYFSCRALTMFSDN